MNFMLTSIIQFLGGIFSVWGNAMTNYNKPQNVESRIINDENKKKDDFHVALKKQDIEKIRTSLSGN